MTSHRGPFKAAGVEVDEQCRFTIDVDLDRPRDDLWHEYLADAADAVPSLDIISAHDNVRLVDLGSQQPQAVRQALDWLLAAIPEVDQQRQEQEDRQRAMQSAAEEHLNQWWGDYVRSKRA